MKKIYSFLAASLLSTGIFAQNLVVNPSFESGLSNWTTGPSTSYTTPTLVTTDANTGTNSAQYSAVTATTGFYQEVPVTAGNTYTISFWYKAQGDNTDARIWSIYKDSAGTLIYQQGTSSSVGTDPLRGPANGYLPAAATWTQFTTTVTAPANVVLLQLAVRAYNNATLAAFDDFSVVQETLGVVDFSNSKYSLVKNTLVSNEIVFAKKSDVKIYNMNGQVVKSASVSENKNLEVADLQPGMYIVTGTVNGEAVSQKILKK